MGKLGLLSIDRTIRSGLQTLIIINSILLTAGLFLVGSYFLRDNPYLSVIFLSLGLVIALSGFFGLATKQLADGLSAGLGLHEQVKSGIRTNQKSMSLEQTLEAGFDVMRVMAGIVFLSILSFSMGSLMDSASEPKTTFTCDDGEIIPISQVEDGFFDCFNARDEVVGTFEEAGAPNQILKILGYGFWIIGIIIAVAGSLGLFTKSIADMVSIGLSLHDDRHIVSGIDDEVQNNSEKGNETDPPKLIGACPQCSVQMKIPDSADIKIRCPKCKLVMAHSGQGRLVPLDSADYKLSDSEE
tara:strand:- start:71 stop:967 length:897 start_codon:yes stop_codon:yes gene_type:complete